MWFNRADKLKIISTFRVTGVQIVSCQYGRDAMSIDTWVLFAAGIGYGALWCLAFMPCCPIDRYPVIISRQPSTFVEPCRPIFVPSMTLLLFNLPPDPDYINTHRGPDFVTHMSARLPLSQPAVLSICGTAHYIPGIMPFTRAGEQTTGPAKLRYYRSTFAFWPYVHIRIFSGGKPNSYQHTTLKLAGIPSPVDAWDAPVSKSVSKERRYGVVRLDCADLKWLPWRVALRLV